MRVFIGIVLYSLVVHVHAFQEDSFLQKIIDEITELKVKQNSCDSEVIELKAVVCELLKRNDKLEQEMLEIRKSMNSPKRGNGFLSEDSTVGLVNNQSRQKRIVNSGQVAFTVGVSSADLTGLGDHHTIVFDNAITNIGNAYNLNSGIFQAPLKGIYVFTLTVMVVPRHSEYLEIIVDGKKINDIFADASSVDDNVSTTKQWVLNINAGSQVWIRTSSYANGGEIHGTMHTAFSGFLLFETE